MKCHLASDQHMKCHFSTFMWNATDLFSPSCDATVILFYMYLNNKQLECADGVNSKQSNICLIEENYNVILKLLKRLTSLELRKFICLPSIYAKIAGISFWIWTHLLFCLRLTGLWHPRLLSSYSLLLWSNMWRRRKLTICPGSRRETWSLFPWL